MTSTHSEAAQRLQGNPAPSFCLPAHDGSTVCLNDLLGQQLILYFYPAALTPGCTLQSCDFRDNMEIFTQHGYTVLGISHDTVEKNNTFHTKKQLPFQLLCDEDFAVHTAYSSYGPKKLYGKTYTGPIRSTFVLNADHVINLALINVRATGHVKSLLKKLSLA